MIVTCRPRVEPRDPDIESDHEPMDISNRADAVSSVGHHSAAEGTTAGGRRPTSAESVIVSLEALADEATAPPPKDQRGSERIARSRLSCQPGHSVAEQARSMGDQRHELRRTFRSSGGRCPTSQPKGETPFSQAHDA